MKIFFTLFLITICLIFWNPSIIAINMDSSRYRIQMGTVNITGGNKESDNYRISDTVGQMAAGEFQSDGYIVKAGFQYIHSICPFMLSISATNVDLGVLTPNTPSTANTDLMVSSCATHSYQVTAIEEGPLKTLALTFIPDTQCNGGSHTCTETQAQSWTTNTAYGFGYNMDGNDIPPDFINNNYYRPFPDQQVNESPVVVMSRQTIGKNRQAKVTFKANISALQPAGSYQTIVSFVATPGY